MKCSCSAFTSCSIQVDSLLWSDIRIVAGSNFIALPADRLLESAEKSDQRPTSADIRGDENTMISPYQGRYWWNIKPSLPVDSVWPAERPPAKLKERVHLYCRGIAVRVPIGPSARWLAAAWADGKLERGGGAGDSF